MENETTSQPSLIFDYNLDFSNICRLCMNSEANLKSIFTDEETCSNITLFANIDIKLNDDLPQRICTECLQNLETCIKFKERCEKSHSTLNKILVTKKIKLEKDAQVDFEDGDYYDEILVEPSSIAKKVEVDVKEESNYLCDECPYIANSQKLLKLHKKQHKQIIKCDVCDKKFKTTSTLNKHKKIHDDNEADTTENEESKDSKESKSSGEKKVCKHCPETFESYKDLSTHVRTLHKEVRQKKCDDCGKVLSSIQAYKIHMRQHTNDRPYVCETCGKSFIQLITLREHYLIHKGALPFKCPHCPHRSRQKQSLIVHMRVHTGERPYSCPMCSQTFTTSSNRAKHIRYHSDATPYHCDQCPKAYSYKDDLLDHMSVVHIGIQRHQCEICLKRFSSNSSLIHHRRVEHNVKRSYTGVGKMPEYLKRQQMNEPITDE